MCFVERQNLSCNTDACIYMCIALHAWPEPEPDEKCFFFFSPRLNPTGQRVRSLAFAQRGGYGQTNKHTNKHDACPPCLSLSRRILKKKKQNATVAASCCVLCLSPNPSTAQRRTACFSVRIFVVYNRLCCCYCLTIIPTPVLLDFSPFVVRNNVKVHDTSYPPTAPPNLSYAP